MKPFAPHADGLVAIVSNDALCWTVRIAAAEALGALGKETPRKGAIVAALENIMEMGDEVDEDVQNASGRALEALGNGW